MLKTEIRVLTALLSIALLAGCASDPTSARNRHQTTAEETEASSAVVALVSHATPARDLFGGFRCAGVLVAPTVVLTARHCVAGLSADQLDVVVNPVDLCGPDPENEMRSPIREIRPTADIDLAVVVMRSSATTSPARIASVLPDARAQLVAVGWGRQATTAPCQRSATGLSFAPAADCARAISHLPRQARRWQLCALPTSDQNTCRGDSGGGLFDVSQAKPLLVGITSAGVGGCEPDDVGLYIRVDTLDTQVARLNEAVNRR
ncbi:trypsin-like serine protease [Pimelobacter simplex]|uniref:S1 family peptidase n=1 Tax=Nocardioides simplex TaxID=2045 RepID=UPI000943FD24|nr:trypsin-like serine protease [Pimelobacter simplex]MCG8152270.1 trypsin-like serine protease [Pimelobacter simplex]